MNFKLTSGSFFVPPGCFSITPWYGFACFSFRLPAGYRRISYAPGYSTEARKTAKTHYQLFFPPTILRICVIDNGIDYAEWVAEGENSSLRIPLPNVSDKEVCLPDPHCDTVTELLEKTLSALWDNFNTDMGVDNMYSGPDSRDFDVDQFLRRWEDTPPDQVGLDWKPVEDGWYTPLRADLTASLNKYYGQFAGSNYHRLVWLAEG